MSSATGMMERRERKEAESVGEEEEMIDVDTIWEDSVNVRWSGAGMIEQLLAVV